MVLSSQERHYTIHYTIQQVYRTSVSRLAALVMEVKPRRRWQRVLASWFVSSYRVEVSLASGDDGRSGRYEGKAQPRSPSPRKCFSTGNVRSEGYCALDA